LLLLRWQFLIQPLIVHCGANGSNC